jgi:superfamily II DNA or RNA helicase
MSTNIKNNKTTKKVFKLKKKEINKKNEIMNINKKNETINFNKKNETINFNNKNNINNLNNLNITEWVLPNKKEFPDWINQTFIKYKSDGKTQTTVPGKYKPFKYQLFLKKYMSNDSPYRGVLLYMGTGSGKTCTSIEIAENLKTERNIVVMLPASLRTNFIVNGLLFCGSNEYKQNPEKIKEKYTFISYNANNTLAQIKRIGSLDNKVIIIDEVHNLVSKMVSGLMGISKQGLEIYNQLMNAQNAKIIAMSGTPIINDPFEAAVLFNILKGYIEINYFRIIKVAGVYGNEWKMDSLENELLKNELIDFIEVNKINKSMEFHFKINNYNEKYQELIEFVTNKCNDMGVTVKFLEKTNVSLFPVDNEGESFKTYFIKENIEKGDQLKNETVFKRRLLGLVSYYKSINENYPTVIYNDFYRIEMSNYQFLIYEILRAKERLTERGSSKSKKSKTVKSTFRVFSRQASNFVFPETVLRPYPDPKFIVSILKKNKNNKNEMTFNKMLAMEENANNGKILEDYKKRIEQGIQKLVENGELYFTPGPDGLDKLSPKMKVILENINKSPGLVFVYSNFRTLEGVELFSKVLDFNGYSKYGKENNLPKYAIYSGTEDEKEKKETLRVFTSNENKYGDQIKIILATSAGAEGLDLKNIRQIHIMEPYWNQMRIEQVIGRGVRRNSHISLLPNERNVSVFRYFSVFSNKNALLTKDKLSTDEHIEQVSIKKQNIINEMLQILRECAFDCYFNKADVKGEYNCFSFGKGAEGFSYHPDIAKDIVESYTIQNTKTVKRTLTKGILTQDGLIYLFDPDKKIFYLYSNKNKKSQNLNKDVKKKQILIDKNSAEIFDVKSVKEGSTYPIGYISKNGKYSKTKR